MLRAIIQGRGPLMTKSIVSRLSIPRFRDWSLGAKLVVVAGISILLALIPASFLAGRHAAQSMQATGMANIGEKALFVVDTLSVYESALRSNSERLHATLISMLPGEVLVDPEGQTVQVGQFETPLLRSGGRVLSLNNDTVDRFAVITGAWASVLARAGDEFVSVSTSLKSADGARAIGAVLGRDHLALQSLVNGQIFIGRVVMFGNEYMTQYVPILGDAGAVVGAVCIGYDIGGGLASLKSKVGMAMLGEAGYFMVIDAREGPGFGTFIVHPELEGKSALEVKDVNGTAYLATLIKQHDGDGVFRIADADGGRRRLGILDRRLR